VGGRDRQPDDARGASPRLGPRRRRKLPRADGCVGEAKRAARHRLHGGDPAASPPPGLSANAAGHRAGLARVSSAVRLAPGTRGTTAICAIPMTLIVAAPAAASTSATCGGLTGKLRGARVIRGGPGADVLIGNGRSQTIFGGGGDDRICAGGGNDVVHGGGGDGTIHGDGRGDTGVGDQGADRLYGDVLAGKLFGGAGGA